MRARLAGVAAVGMLLVASVSTLGQERSADVCLELAPGALTTEELAAVSSAVADALVVRGALFPSPTIEAAGSRLDIHSGHAGLASGQASCLQAGAEWTARFDRAFLEAGADRMLAQAPTTPGIESDVTIEWDPATSRLRTTLVFAGPLDIPNGTCWIDDELSIDEAGRAVVASGEQGVRTSPFAEGACRRFFDHLPEGGAGAQSVTLLPSMVGLAEGRTLRFAPDEVSVSDDAVTVWGRLERD